jgi:hypothetical protein
MDSDDDNEEFDVTEEFFQHSLTTDTSERKTFFDHFQRFIPRQTIIYIQYCLLRIPFLLLYDYLFTEQFSLLFEYFFQYSLEIIDQENRIFFKPLSYILHSYLFQLLLRINLIFSIPVLGKFDFMPRKVNFQESSLFCRSYFIDCFIIMFGSASCDFLQLYNIVTCYLFLLSNKSFNGYSTKYVYSSIYTFLYLYSNAKYTFTCLYIFNSNTFMSYSTIHIPHHTLFISIKI